MRIDNNRKSSINLFFHMSEQIFILFKKRYPNGANRKVLQEKTDVYVDFLSGNPKKIDKIKNINENLSIMWILEVCDKDFISPKDIFI